MKSLTELYREIDKLRGEIMFLITKITITYIPADLIIYTNTINEKFTELKAYLISA